MGTVHIVTSPLNRVSVQTALPEALFVDRETGDLEEVARTARALVVGPAMGTDDASADVLGRMLRGAGGPALLDADALTLVAREPALLPADRRDRYLLIPHPGEMGRLLGLDTEQVTADPFAAVEAARDRYGCAILLKGSPTLVATPGEPTLANVTGHSGVGVGGMGDTLAGLAGALMARGIVPREAGAMAIYYAGRAADRVGRGRPILPRDVAEMLPHVLGQADEREAGSRAPEVLLELEPAE